MDKLINQEMFFLLAGPCVIEGEEMALNIAEHVKKVTDRLGIPYVFKGSFKKANRSRLDSFTGIGDEKALKILAKVRAEFGIPVVPSTWMCYRSRLFYVARPICWWLLQKQERS